MSLRVLASPPWRALSGNPYAGLLYRHIQEHGVVVDEARLRDVVGARPDVWHLHWPESALKPHSAARAGVRTAGLLGVMAVARLRGTRTVWTVHNLDPHELRHPRLAQLFWFLFPRLVDAVISLSREGARLARARWPALCTVPIAVIRHGHYRDAYPAAPTRAAGRAQLGLPADARVILCFGQIRSYKGLPQLVAAARGMKQVHVVIAGDPRDEISADAVVAAAAGDPCVHVRLGFVPSPEVPALFAAADLVVLPYLEGLHSGVALLSLSFDRPLLVPDRAAFRELRDDVGARWVHVFDGDLTSDDLERALSSAALVDGERAPLGAHDWAHIAKATVEVYCAVTAQAPTASPS